MPAGPGPCPPSRGPADGFRSPVRLPGLCPTWAYSPARPLSCLACCKPAGCRGSCHLRWYQGRCGLLRTGGAKPSAKQSQNGQPQGASLLAVVASGSVDSVRGRCRCGVSCTWPLTDVPHGRDTLRAGGSEEHGLGPRPGLDSHQGVQSTPLPGQMEVWSSMGGPGSWAREEVGRVGLGLRDAHQLAWLGLRQQVSVGGARAALCILQ